MKNKMRIGEFLIERGVATPEDVLQALDQQNQQRKPFHRTAVDLGFLSVKDAYSVYNHRAGTEETFQEAALKLGLLTAGQVDQINRAIDAESKRLGEILVAMNVVTSRRMVSELREFKKLLRQQEEFRSRVGELPLFADLDEAALDALADAAREAICDEKRPVFAQGDPADRLWAVLSGVVTLTAMSEEEGDDREAVTTYVHPGEVFGETALFDADSRRSANAAAEAGSVLIEFERELLREALIEHQRAAAGILQRLLARIVGRLAYVGVSLGELGIS